MAFVQAPRTYKRRFLRLSQGLGGTFEFDESSWLKKVEAGKQAKVKRREEKYKAAEINVPLNPSKGIWRIDTGHCEHTLVLSHSYLRLRWNKSMGRL